MKRSYSDLDQHTGDPPFAFGPAARGPRQPKQYQQQTEPSTGKIKACMQCGTTRTPQWREGPYGPKTLCNACGVKRVRAIKAQQGKSPSQAAHPGAGAGAKKKASAAARTESIELATTLQLLAGNLDAGPPAAKRARTGQVGGRGRKANSMQAAPKHVPEYDPFDPAAAAAMSAPALGSAVQKAIAAIAAKGSMGGESNPTDSGEEISWSPTNHQPTGDAAAAAAAGADGRRQRQQQQQQQLRAAMAAAAAAHMQAAAAGGEQEDLLAAACLQGQQQFEASLAEGYGTAAAAAEAGQDGTGAAVDEEAAAVANLLSMSAAPADPQQPGIDLQPAGSAGKAAMREFVAQLAAGSSVPAATPAAKSPARRQGVRASPSRHVVTVRQRGAAAAAAAAPGAAEALLEDDVTYLLGPGMAVMARYVAPEELLEVIKLNELASEAQRSKAAAEAAVEAVEQILRDKQAAALTAQAAARNAMQRLHSYVGVLNTQHSLLLKAVQEQQPASLANRLAAGAQAGTLTHLDLLAASLQQQQMQQMQPEACASVVAEKQPLQQLLQQQEAVLGQEQQPVQGTDLAGLAAAAAAAATESGAVKAEQSGEGVGAGLGVGGELVVEPLVVQEVAGGAGVDGACVDAAMGADAAVGVAAKAAAAAPAAVEAPGVDAVPVAEVLPQQPAPAADAAADAAAQQHELGPQGQPAEAAALPAPSSEQQEAGASAAPPADAQEVQDAQLLGSLQELAAIAGMFTGADNNGAAAALGGSPALV